MPLIKMSSWQIARWQLCCSWSCWRKWLTWNGFVNTSLWNIKGIILSHRQNPHSDKICNMGAKRKTCSLQAGWSQRQSWDTFVLAPSFTIHIIYFSLKEQGARSDKWPKRLCQVRSPIRKLATQETYSGTHPSSKQQFKRKPASLDPKQETEIE